MNKSADPNRRSILRCGTAYSAGVLTAATASNGFHTAAAERDPHRVLKIGLIGCGGRGTGAINDSLSINKNVKLAAVADVDAARCETTLRGMTRRHKERVDVSPEHVFVGLDAFEQLLALSEIDLVLIASPPGFHPSHTAAAVRAGKHVFCEKPSCVDVAGYKLCLQAHDEALKNGTAIVTGTQYRRQTNYVSAIERIHEGMIGDVISATCRYCSSGIWFKNREEEMSDAQYQIFNWMHFTWLAGDQICEQAVHNIDTLNWVMGGPPSIAYGSGGRFTRPEGSEMWDSMTVDYIYPGNRTLSFMCRQIPGIDGDNSNVIYGTQGIATIHAGSRGSQITDRDGNEIWSMKGSIADAYKQEHRSLVNSIRSGRPIVEFRQTAESSLTAVMGQMAAYTGKEVTWEFMADKSKLDLFPVNLDWEGGLPPASHAIPGKTKLI